MQWATDQRSVIRAGEIMAHQFPGDPSCPPGSPVLLERSDRSVCTAADGQHHYSGVYQQTGGNGVPSVDQSSKVPVAVGTAEGYYADSPTHTRCIQLGSRHGIQDRQGSLRLETQSCSVCQD